MRIPGPGPRARFIFALLVGLALGPSLGPVGDASAQRAAPKPVAPPQPPASPPNGPATATPAPADKAAEKPKGTSFWEPLTTAGSRWVFQPESPGETPIYITVEVYDVRVIKGAKVARLRWSVISGNTSSPMGNSLPTQIAVTKKGAWLLTDKLDDDAVAKALKGKLTYADPPRVSKGDDGYVRKDGEHYCVGVGSPPGSPCPTGVCHAEYCLAKGVGLTSIAGNYTPSAGRFIAPKPTPIPELLSVGIPECDDWLGAYYRCIAQTPNFDEQTRRELLRNLEQSAAGLRQQASTKDPAARNMVIEQCRQARDYMPQLLQSLGCSP